MISIAARVGLLLTYGGGSEFYVGLGMLCLDGCVYFCIAALRVVRPNLISNLYRSAYFSAKQRTERTVDLEMEAVGFRGGLSEDEDVARERARACGDVPGGSPSIVIKQLVKRFVAVAHGKRIIKRAVNDLSLRIDHGECFGLLGPNGAGKTTLQDMLTGLQRADGGSATIAGFDISTQMRKVHRIIGVCPQFDKIWPELSVRHRARPFPAI